jgi:hypothetical protein
MLPLRYRLPIVPPGQPAVGGRFAVLRVSCSRLAARNRPAKFAESPSRGIGLYWLSTIGNLDGWGGTSWRLCRAATIDPGLSASTDAAVGPAALGVNNRPINPSSRLELSAICGIAYVSRVGRPSYAHWALPFPNYALADAARAECQ